jgi:hypothetical protein
MGQRFLIVAFVVAACVASGMASAATSGGKDSVVGGARDAFDANVSTSAQSAPSGENPSGHINATLPSPGTPGDTFHVRLEVVCLAVVGNLAAVGAVVTESSSNDLPPGTPFVVLYRDTGLPGGAGDSIEPLLGAPAMDCAAFVGLAAASPPVRNGNISIYDASP